MARYRRVNIDGKSLFKTETRVLAAAMLPGTFVVINGTDQFVQVGGVVGRMYILDVAHHEGLSILDQIPAGHSGIGNYLEEGREFAVRMAAGAYKKDQPVTVNASGMAAAIPGGAGTYQVIGYIQENVTLAGVDFVRIRARASTVTV